jgi:hypothetical protein
MRQGGHQLGGSSKKVRGTGLNNRHLKGIVASAVRYSNRGEETAENLALNLAARVQSALAQFTSLPPPAAGAFAIASLYGAGAGRATNTGEPLVMQCVVGQALFADVFPDLGFGPIKQWTYFV